MNNDSTPLKTSSRPRRQSQSGCNPAPRKSTIAFIRQFARAYSCAPTLPVALGGFVAN